MSNQNAGAVYAQIIDDVIDSSRVDFEEGGTEEAVLIELKKRWQGMLSQLQIAQFPWDPKIEAEPTAPSTATPTPAPAPVPASAPAPVPVAHPSASAAATAYAAQAQMSPPQNVQPLSLPGAPAHQSTHDVQIKTEPGLGKADGAIKQEPGLVNNGFPPARPSYPPPMGRGMAVAQQRAAQALENQYGQRAAASISALQGGMAQQLPQVNPAQSQQTQRPGQPAQPLSPQQYRQGVAAAMTAQQQRVQQQPHANGQNGVGHSQVDGPTDCFEGVLARRDADGSLVEMARVDIDNLLHAKIAARAKQMEGGGLMLPVKEATRRRGLESGKSNCAGPSQLDGPEDDDAVADENAINSDLDDPDEEQDDDDDDDENMGNLMLCMYDKVQRVKNKWKCTLKDGVLTVNGKEYVFHKATGEYEW